MDHTVKGYLARMRTDHLEGALQYYCSSEGLLYSNRDAVLAILQELEKRYAPPEGELPLQVQQAWEKYLQRIAEAEEASE